MSAMTASFDRSESLEVDVDLGRMDALGVLVEFRAPRAPTDGVPRALGIRAVRQSCRVDGLGQRNTRIV